MNRPNKCYDTIDGQIWGSRSVAVAHIIYCNVNDVMHMLITKRADTMPDEPGKWCFPCGYLDWDETIEEAAIRETKEEANFNILDVKENALILTATIGVHSKPDSERQNISIKILSCLDVDSLPPISITEETSEVMWATGEDMIRLEKEFAFDHYSIFLNSLNVVEDVLRNL